MRTSPRSRQPAHVLRIREPDWFEHRLLKGVDPAVNLHVFPAGCAELERMLRLATTCAQTRPTGAIPAHEARAGAQTWEHVQHYADAKSAVVEEIMGRAP